MTGSPSEDVLRPLHLDEDPPSPAIPLSFLALVIGALLGAVLL